MPTTEPVSGWPVPEASDPPDGPAQILALAAAIAADVKGIQTGVAQVTVGTSTGDEGTIAITFPNAYAATPKVLVSQGPTDLNFMMVRSQYVTTAGFSITCRRIAGAGPGDATWVAFGELA